MENQLLTKQEAAARLRISIVTLDRLRRQGVIRARKLGRHVYLLPDDIQRAIANATDNLNPTEATK